MSLFRKKRTSRADVVLDKIDIDILNVLNEKDSIVTTMKSKTFITDRAMKLHTTRLEALGLIKYQRTGENNRFKLYSLTEKGKIIQGLLK